MKKVAIVGWAMGPNSIGITNTYFDYISQHLGAEVIMINMSMSDETVSEIAKSVDLLILPGGADLSAHLYGARPSVWNSNPDMHKEFFFVRHLDKFIENRTPVFGICLGFQMLNVKFGGTLTQHINALHQSDRRYSEAHKIYDVDKKRTISVNSHHHQAVKYKNLSGEMVIKSISDEFDKEMKHISDRTSIVESFIHKSLPVAGVQWHPEEWFDSHSDSLIREIVQRSKSYKNEQSRQMASS